MLGHPVRACLRPASEGIEEEGPGLCRGTAEGAEDAGFLVSAGFLSDHRNGVMSAAVLVCQDVCVLGCPWGSVLFD